MIKTAAISGALDVYAIRQQFPILNREVKGNRLVYFDNAATTQKPQEVIDALVNYYTGYNANIHRGIHTLAEEATAAFEATRDTAKQFINAASREEIIFTRGTTESINLVAYTYGRQHVQAGDEIIISAMEHHSNIVPWQILCEEKKANLKIVPVNDRGELMMEEYEKLLSERTKIVSVMYVSNAMGTVNPVSTIINKAHAIGAVVVIDGAQAMAHLDVDVQELDVDFLALSAHKMYGPTGVGVLYGKKSLLIDMPVFQGGGEMIKEVTFEKTTYNDLPYKFEAGTPNIADTVAFKAAIDFVTRTGKKNMHEHEQELLAYATEKLSQIKGVHIKGQAKDKISVLSFIVDNIHPQDLGILLDNRGVAVRTGHHCCQPLMTCFGIPGTTRASFAVYNTMEEVDELVAGVQKAIKILS
jgi:cysteine desulfurase / selenocysteine lyase